MRRLAVIVVMVGCVPALADLVPIGDPGYTGSWDQRFGENAGDAIDLLAVRMVTIDEYFKTPATRDFSEPSWSLALDRAQLASAWGDGVSSLEWNVHFAGDASSALAFDYVAFSGDEIVNAARVSWSGTALDSGWLVTNFPGGIGADWTPDPGDVVPIPVPGAALLGAIGLACLRWAKRHA